MLAEQLRHTGADQQTAAAFYSGSFVVTVVFFNVLWQVAAPGHRLIEPGSERAATEVSRRYRYGIPSYLAATLAAI